MTSTSDTFPCPADGCSFAGSLNSLLGHLKSTHSNGHSWAALGFNDSAEFMREYVAPQATSPTDDQGPPPCQLTELYEVFRSLRTIVERVLYSESSSIEPCDLSHPLTRYHKLIDAVVGGDSGRNIFVGYGAQHTDQVSHTVNDYRLKYGNGNWITAYQTIEVELLKEQTRKELSSRDIVDDPKLFVRPLAPDGSAPLPEAVKSEDQLQQAISILSRFPATPATHPAEGTSSDGIPAQEMYASIISGSEIEIEQLKTDEAEMAPTSRDFYPDWRESPAALTVPQTADEIDNFLANYEKLTYLTKRVEPPSDVLVDEPIQVFTLDYYEPTGAPGESSQHSYRVLSIKDEEEEYMDHFRARLREFVGRRILTDDIGFDFITVYPGHEAGSLSPNLVSLAKDATVETPIIYAELLERTKTMNRQQTKSSDRRWNLCRAPGESLRVRHQVSEANVIILDDVVTSGSSLAAGAHLLRNAGANRVIGLGLGLTGPQSGETVRTIENPDAGVSDILKHDT